MFNRIIKIQ